MCCSKPILSFSPNSKSDMSCRNCSMCFCFNFDMPTIQYPSINTPGWQIGDCNACLKAMDYVRSINFNKIKMYGLISELMWEEIELTITSWTLQPGDLFEYNSIQANERQQFRAVQFHLPIPREQPVFYFFHLLKKKIKDDRYDYFLERRSKQFSDLSEKPEGPTMFKLVGGVKLSRKLFKNRECVFAEPIQASRIERVKVEGKLEEVEYADPYLVVRTFKHGCAVRQGQTLRFGKVQFMVREINTCLMREVDYGTDNDQVLNLDEIKEASNYVTFNQREGDQQEEGSQMGRQCRVCLMNEQEDGNMLLSPCQCKGTHSFVHLQCLREWIQQKLKKMREGDGAFYQTNLLFCEICKQKFPRAVIKQGKTYGLLKFLEESNPYIALSTKQNTAEENMFYISFEETSAVKVGRLLQNGVVLQEQSVSRKHAIIEFKNNEMIIKDDDSKYGTLLREDGLEFRVRKKLRAFQVANTVFSFRMKETERSY